MIPFYNTQRFLHKSLQQPLYALRVLVKRLVAYCHYFYADGKSSLPEALTFFLTYRCNLQCQMCGQWGREGVTKKQSAQYLHSEIRVQEMKTIIDGLATFRPNITLFGGEPLLYPNCLELIRYIKAKGMHCLLITNGSMIQEYARDIVESGLDELNVSLDGAQALHDQIRNLPGLFEKIVQGLEKVQHLKAQMKNKKPLLNLQCTITKYNYEHLEQLFAVADRLRADALTFHNLIFLNDSILQKQKEFDRLLDCGCVDWEGFKFEPGIDPKKLYNNIANIMSVKHKFAVDFYPNFSRLALMEYYTKSDYTGLSGASRCISPWVAAYILPDGQVKPCLNSSYAYGNILTTKFSELWNNQQAIKFRRFLRNKRIFPVCARCTELYRY